MSKPWRYEFQAVKTADGLKFTSRAFFDRAVSTLGDGESVLVTIKKPQDKRSLQQNKALWGPIYDQLMAGLRDAQVIDPDEVIAKEYMHEGLLQEFSGTVKDPVTKREVAKERSSTMTTARFGEFVEWIARFAAREYGVVVTLPGEY